VTDITITGNLAGDPDLKFSQNGKAWARFTVVANDRVFDKNTNAWVDRDPTFWRCTAFGKTAENLAEGASKGTRIVVLGKVKSESYKDKEGNDVTEMRVTADEVAVSLKFGAPKGAATGRPQAAPDDPWGTPPF